MDRALELAGDHGGTVRSRADKGEGGSGGNGAGADPVGAWRQAFLRAPYLRDLFIRMGILSDTFETAITWDRFPEFHASVMEAANDAARRVCGAGARVSCRFTPRLSGRPGAVLHDRRSRAARHRRSSSGTRSRRPRRTR